MNLSVSRSPGPRPASRRRWRAGLTLLVALGAGWLSGPASTPAEAQRRRPNFLIIVTDDQRQETLNSEYMPLTKAMIVDQGVWFDRGYTTTPLCCPGRSSIFTGMYARNHGVLRNPDVLEQTTVAERVQLGGYHTGLVGKYLNSWNEASGPPPGFDFWVAHAGGGSRFFDPRLGVNGEWSIHEGYITYLLRDFALQFLSEAPRDQPFLLFFTPNAPHSPADPAPGHEDLYPDLPPHRPPSFDEKDVSDKPLWVQRLAPISDAQAEAIEVFRRKQLQSLKSLDESIGSLLNLLRRQGRLDNTVVIFISDNGFFWGEHRIRQGKNRVYEESQKVPFALRYPPLVSRPRVEARLVANIDITPTILQLAGLRIPRNVDGRSLVPLLRGATRWRDALLLESWPAQPYAAILTTQYVYVETINQRSELYDLETDPYQLENVVEDPAYAEVVEVLRQRLAEGH